MIILIVYSWKTSYFDPAYTGIKNISMHIYLKYDVIKLHLEQLPWEVAQYLAIGLQELVAES